MAEDQGAVAAEIIDVAVAVDVPLMGAFGAGDVDAVGVDVAGVMGDAGGQQFERLLREVARAGRFLAVGGDDAGVDAGIVDNGAGHVGPPERRDPHCATICAAWGGVAEIFRGVEHPVT